MLKKILFFTFLLVWFNGHCQYCVEDVFANSFGNLGHCVAVTTNDNKILYYGGNANGQLGNGSKTEQTIFSNPFISDNDWKMISFGSGHTLGIKKDGSLWSWGTNECGRLGNATINSDNFSPKQIGSDKDWEMVSAGTWHSLALKKDGTLWGWGNTRTESLGYFHFNLPSDQTTPIQLNDDTDWSYIHASIYTTLAIKKNGSLYGTGGVRVGNENSGANAPLRFPEDTKPQSNGLYKIGNENKWKKIITGSDIFFVMLKNDNTLWGWSYDTKGTSNIDIENVIYCTQYAQIGDSKWKDFDISHNAFIGIKENGTLWHFGFLTYDILNKETAQIGTESNWKKVAAGHNNHYLIKEDNSLWFLGLSKVHQGFESNSTSEEPRLIYACKNAPNSNEGSLNFILYPNPTSDMLFWSKDISIRKITIYSENGEAVLFQNVVNNHLDVSLLSHGTYIVKLEAANNMIYKSKFVKK